MIVRGFKSVIWVATVGGAALSCYMVSLQVATERAELDKVEGQIIAAKREIRSLQTELGTRGRLSQLEEWNAEVLALSAPSSAQYLSDGLKLARFERRDPTTGERAAEIRMAALHTGDSLPAAPAAAAKPAIVQAVAPAPVAAAPAVHRASFTPAAAAPQLAALPRTAPRTLDAPKTATNAPAKPATASDADVKAPRRVATGAAAAKPAVKAEPKVAAKTPAATVRTSRLDSKLVSEIRSAAAKGQGGGGN
jgi:hypothetical protein